MPWLFEEGRYGRVNRREVLAGSRADRRTCRCEPVVPVWLVAAGDGEEFFLKLASYRPSFVLADLYAVDRADGRDLDSRAGEEEFVDDVEHFAGDDLLFHGNAQILGESHDRVAGDARQNAGRQRRAIERAIVDEEDVF